MILLNFPIRWSSNIMNLFNILMILNKWIIRCPHLMLLSSLLWVVVCIWYFFQNIHRQFSNHSSYSLRVGPQMSRLETSDKSCVDLFKLLWVLSLSKLLEKVFFTKLCLYILNVLFNHFLCVGSLLIQPLTHFLLWRKI